MEPEETIPSKSRTFLKIALGVFVVLILLAVTAYILTARKNAREVGIQKESQALITVPLRTYTDAEKLQTLEDFTKQDTGTSLLSEKEKFSMLKKFSVKQSTSTLLEAGKAKVLQDFINSQTQ